MKLIVGLGNPGEKYQNNRHNVGFMFVDYILETCNSQLVTQGQKLGFKTNKYLFSEIIEFNEKLEVSSYKLQDFVLVKPLTFMNRSGRAVSSCITSYKLQVTSDLIVVHDDLDIPLGKFKIQIGTGPQLHNGIDSINANLKTHNYLRIRIGVDNRPLENRINGETYVLQDFTKEEVIIILDKIFPAIFSQLVTNKLI